MSISSAQTLATRAGSIDVVSSTGSDKIDLRQLLVRLPNGTPLVSADGFSLRSHERTLVTGPSGAGKSTLFRAIAGIWPFGGGAIAIPAKATLMMLPQRPYFPLGSLKAAIVYPAEASRLVIARHWGRSISATWYCHATATGLSWRIETRRSSSRSWRAPGGASRRTMHPRPEHRPLFKCWIRS
jgi:energy-coupling factor transporter ATP-binding protein EcfA2